MVEYVCNRCGYNAKQKINLVRHLNRKNICPQLLEDISIDEIKFMYGFEIKNNEPKMNPIEPKMNPTEPKMILSFEPKMNLNEPKMNLNEPKMNPNEPKINLNEYRYECIYCSRCYSTNSHMRRHEKNCKIKKDQEKQYLEKNDEIKNLKEMVEKLLLERGNNITHNTNNSNNTTNNIININNYGDEDTKYITSDYILKLLKNKPARTISELIKYTHFNDAHPENQNIKITNKKEPYIKVRKNDKWELQDKDATITDLIDRQQIHLMDEDVEKKIETVCNSSEKVNIERCKELYNEDNKEYMKRLYNESELIIINNS